MDNKYIFEDGYVIPRHLRKLKFSRKHKTGLVFSLFAVIAAFFAKLSILKDFSLFSLQLIRSLSDGKGIEIVPSRIWDFCYCFQMTVSYPSMKTCIIVAVVTIIMMLIIPRIKSLPLPVTIMCNLLISPLAVFSALFIFLPDWFYFDPFSMSDMVTITCSLILLGMNLLMWLFLAPVPITLWKRLLLLLVFDCILIILYVLKHFLFLVIYKHATMLFVPYILLLVLTMWDIIWMNAFYSLIVSKASKKANNDNTLWSKI